ncbi:hypothetical protein SAMN05421679_105234 [Epilithonimonas pallida]|uniref:Uncharacterized protein n=1 Tax=Epilithonimonas pallida TaxID=373671 RepID=A0ABY1R6N5_9FLAO|nr:hypothetical protein SAMN05421679_105234 [Epilithonimonas pallida]
MIVFYTTNLLTDTYDIMEVKKGEMVIFTYLSIYGILPG